MWEQIIHQTELIQKNSFTKFVAVGSIATMMSSLYARHPYGLIQVETLFELLHIFETL